MHVATHTAVHQSIDVLTTIQQNIIFAYCNRKRYTYPFILLAYAHLCATTEPCDVPQHNFCGLNTRFVCVYSFSDVRYAMLRGTMHSQQNTNANTTKDAFDPYARKLQQLQQQPNVHLAFKWKPFNIAFRIVSAYKPTWTTADRRGVGFNTKKGHLNRLHCPVVCKE